MKPFKYLIANALIGITSLTAVTPATLALTAPQALAQEVSTVASVDLSFDASQIQTMLSKMNETSITEADQDFINSIIANPLDKNAIDAAQAVIQKRLQWSMHELSELKKVAIRYMIVSSQVKTKDYLKLIAKGHTERAQDHYNRAMWSLAGAYQDLPDVLAECATELCAIKVTEAFKELRQFVENVNQDLDFENANSSLDLFWKFENPILKTSLDKTFRKMIPNNEDHNAWKAAGAALLAPLSFAGQVAYSYGKAVGTAILNPRYLRIKFSVDEVRMDYDAIDEQFENQIKDNLNNRDFIMSAVGYPDYYHPSAGMFKIVHYLVEKSSASYENITVGKCLVNLYGGSIYGPNIDYSYRYGSTYDSDLKKAAKDILKRLYDAGCDR